MNFPNGFCGQKPNTRGVFDVVLRSTFYVLLSLCYFLFSILPAYAISTNFVTRTLVGDDTTPPTVPGSLIATPIATSQINLAWSTSTDDVTLSGYQVFRDGFQVGTTTATSYSDIGLYASTTYTYYVTAFDSFMNVSASSSLAATTTFATATPPASDPSDPEDGPIFGSRARTVDLVSLEVIPSEHGAVIRFTTDEYARAVVRWGKTLAYEIGSSREEPFLYEHEITVSDLQSDTSYRFSIEALDTKGRFGTLHEGTFRTLMEEDTTPPGLVTNIVLTKKNDDLELTWTNPRDVDFDHVRVVRSDRFYPTNEFEGWVVYEGDGNEARDPDVALPGKRLFYALFAYDEKGNISAGAVARFVVDGGIEPPFPETNTIAFDFNDIEFFQEGRLIPHTKETVRVSGAQHLTVSVPYDKLPEHLKTILVRIVPQSDTSKELSFILRINTEKTAFTARLAPIGISGEFVIHASVFDFETKQVGYTRGNLQVTLRMLQGGNGTPLLDDDKNPVARFELWMVLFLILILLCIAYLVRRMLFTHNKEVKGYPEEEKNN